jgi:hypothetical protein
VSTRPPPALDDLTPLPYQAAVVAYLKEHEPEVWTWGSSAEAESDYLEQMRTTLLKECYRLEAGVHGELVSRCSLVAERLGVAAAITLYQANGDAPMNAALYYAPGEAHVVFTGAVLERLHGAELDAVLAHELAHYRLWEQHGRDCLVADRLMLAAANDPRASASHRHTAQRLRLYTEIYADRGAYIGCGQLEPAIAALVKMATGLRQVSAAGYLSQADELFSLKERSARDTDHPETFIRARALRLWTERDDGLDAWLGREIEGDATVDTLCLLGQQRVTRLTRRVIAELLRPRWMRTDPLLAHARSFFADFAPAGAADDALEAELAEYQAASQDYWCYLLLDFARADRDLEDLPLAHAIATARRFGWHERLEKLAAEELRLNKRQLAKLRTEGPALLAKVELP